MGAPTTTNSGTNVIISWSPLSANGATISEYLIEIQQQAGTTYTSDLTNCDGASSSVILNTQCTIPMATLTSSPYFLVQGDLVVARVTAKNSVGWNAASSDNTSGADVRTVPLTPNAPTKDSSLTDES